MSGSEAEDLSLENMFAVVASDMGIGSETRSRNGLLGSKYTKQCLHVKLFPKLCQGPPRVEMTCPSLIAFRLLIQFAL